MPSTLNVRAASTGKLGWSDISKRYVTVPTVPVGVELLTTSVGRGTVIVVPPTGALAVGADSAAGVAAALCDSENDVLPTVIVAVRAVPVFAATVKFTVPLPLPDAPAVIVTKFEELVAVQVQPVPAVTVTVPVPPAAANDVAVVAAVTVHVGVVGVVGVVLLSFEHADARSSAATAPHNGTSTRRRMSLTSTRMIGLPKSIY
jgi:hypothetical protein